MDEEIVYYIGNTRPIKFYFQDIDEGGMLNLSGSTLVFSVKKDDTEDNTTIQKTTGDIAQGEIVDAVGGEVQFFILVGDTSALRPGRYVYDVQMTDQDSVLSTLVKAVFNLQRPVT